MFQASNTSRLLRELDVQADAGAGTAEPVPVREPVADATK
jgi:hypothetical protein